jgi:hypothetical protein
MIAVTNRTTISRTDVSRTNVKRTQREPTERGMEVGHAPRGANSGPRHVSQILPDVLARYGITPEAMEQSAAAGRGRLSGPAIERSPVGAALELAPVAGNPTACAVGCW